MAFTGRVIRFNFERGFGFIRPLRPAQYGESDVFVHAQAVRDSGLVPEELIDQIVEYDLVTDARSGKLRAVRLALA